MVSYNTKNKSAAEKKALNARKKGFNAHIYKKIKGWGVSVTRKNSESFLKPSWSYRRQLSKYEKEIQRPTMRELLHEPMAKKHIAESPLLKEYVQKAIKLKKKLEETDADTKTILREKKKLKDEFYKRLIKKYPKEKKEISRLRKEMEEFADIKLRTLELIRIAKQRALTKKESQELKNIASK